MNLHFKCARAEALLLRFFLKFQTTSKTSAELQRDHQYHFHASSRYLLDHKSTIDSSHVKQSKALLILFLKIWVLLLPCVFA